MRASRHFASFTLANDVASNSMHLISLLAIATVSVGSVTAELSELEQQILQWPAGTLVSGDFVGLLNEDEIAALQADPSSAQAKWNDTIAILSDAEHLDAVRTATKESIGKYQGFRTRVARLLKDKAQTRTGASGQMHRSRRGRTFARKRLLLVLDSMLDNPIIKAKMTEDLGESSSAISQLLGPETATRFLAALNDKEGDDFKGTGIFGDRNVYGHPVAIITIDVFPSAYHSLMR